VILISILRNVGVQWMAISSIHTVDGALKLRPDRLRTDDHLCDTESYCGVTGFSSEPQQTAARASPHEGA
jgi:hypothetical protein